MSQNNVQLQNGNGPLAGLRNQLINGNMEVDQRGTGANSVIPDTFTLDRWVVWVQGITDQPAFSWGKAVTTMNVASEKGFSYCLEVRNPLNADWNVKQGIEINDNIATGPFVQGSTWTFTCYSSKKVQAGLAKADGTGAGTAANFNTRTYSNWDSSTGLYTAHFTIDATAPAGYNCMLLGIYNDTGVINAATQITGCQLEPGPIATPFEVRPIGLELSLCQRYFISLNLGNRSVSESSGMIKTGATFDGNIYPYVTIIASMRNVGNPGNLVVDVTDLECATRPNTVNGAASLRNARTRSRGENGYYQISLGCDNAPASSSGFFLGMGGSFTVSAEL